MQQVAALVGPGKAQILVERQHRDKRMPGFVDVLGHRGGFQHRDGAVDVSGSRVGDDGIVGAERPVEAGEAELESMTQGFARKQGEVDFTTRFIAIKHCVFLALFQQALVPGAQVGIGKCGGGGAECPDFLLAVDKAPDFSLYEIKPGQEELRDEFFERVFEVLE